MDRCTILLLLYYHLELLGIAPFTRGLGVPHLKSNEGLSQSDKFLVGVRIVVHSEARLIVIASAARRLHHGYLLQVNHIRYIVDLGLAAHCRLLKFEIIDSFVLPRLPRVLPLQESLKHFVFAAWADRSLRLNRYSFDMGWRRHEIRRFNTVAVLVMCPHLVLYRLVLMVLRHQVGLEAAKAHLILNLILLRKLEFLSQLFLLKFGSIAHCLLTELAQVLQPLVEIRSDQLGLERAFLHQSYIILSLLLFFMCHGLELGLSLPLELASVEFIIVLLLFLRQRLDRRGLRWLGSLFDLVGKFGV